jgi:hypothetical protein
MQAESRIVPKPLRVTGIVVCGLLLLLPPGICWIVASPQIMKLMHFISLISPVPFVLLVLVCIDEGRARERRDQQHPPA